MKYQSLLFALLLPLGSFAQSSADDAQQQTVLGAGRINLGVGVSQGYGQSTSSLVRFTPRLQYFIRDGWSVALEGQFARNYFSQDRYTGAGLTTRYYFLRSRRFAMFGEVGASYGQNINKKQSYNSVGLTDPVSTKTNLFRTHAGLGVHYRVGQRWSIEAGVTRALSGKQEITRDAAYAPWRIGAGVNFRLK